MEEQDRDLPILTLSDTLPFTLAGLSHSGFTTGWIYSETQVGLEIKADDQRKNFASFISLSDKRESWAWLSPGPNLLTEAGWVNLIDAHQASVALKPGEAEGQASSCLSSIC